MKISSKNSPHVKRLLHLHQASKRRREGVFLIEGYRELDRALRAGVKIQTAYVAEDCFRRLEAFELVQALQTQSIEAFELTAEAFEKVSTREGPDGLLAIAEPWDFNLEKILVQGTPLFMVVEGVEKPGNLGALIRSAEAAGVTGLILVDPVVDPLNPAVIRNSQGALFTIPLAVASFEATCAFLHHHKAHIVATAPQADKLYWEAALNGSVAIVLGCEKDGLQPRWLDMSTTHVRIPMHGAGDSLNLGAAAVIVVYEALRQRAYYTSLTP